MEEEARNWGKEVTNIQHCIDRGSMYNSFSNSLTQNNLHDKLETTLDVHHKTLLNSNDDEKHLTSVDGSVEQEKISSNSRVAAILKTLGNVDCIR